LRPVNFRSSWLSALSPWQNSPLVPTQPILPTSGPVGRIDYNGRKQRSIPFPSTAKRLAAYGRIDAAEVASGRKARGTRALDLLIAATACAARLPIYTRNPEDFQSLRGFVDVVAV
jgi:hypothetical protein